ncbi:MAG: thioesterase family protein, partial [Streptomyces sp.]|nr:thioesterase family protein [Streptomyces sp.]
MNPIEEKHPLSPDSYYESVADHRYKPTTHTGGAWAPDEQHFSPLGGLVVHALDRHRAGRPDDGLVLSRISYDILGRLALDECEIAVETVRPGRTIELLEAVVRIAGRPVVRARAWFLAALDTSAVADGAEDLLSPPESLAPWPMSEVWPGGYINSVEVRPVAPPRPGRT